MARVAVLVLLIALLGTFVANLPIRDHSYPWASAALGDVRGFVSSQNAYASVTGSYAPTIGCLKVPHECITDYPEDAPAFVASSFETIHRPFGTPHYINYSFHPGPLDTDGKGVASYVYMALPTDELKRAGGWGVCGDDTGRVCVTVDGTAPSFENGRCVVVDAPLPARPNVVQRALMWLGVLGRPEPGICYSRF